MLSKSNQWIVLAAVVAATSFLIGCNQGGGGGGAPAVDCRQVQNWNNTTCLNARRGNALPYNGGIRPPVGSGEGRARPLQDGIIPLTSPNMNFMNALCNSSGQQARRPVGPVRRSNTGWGGSSDDGAYYQDASLLFNQVCMNIGTVVLTFETFEDSKDSHARYSIGWKFYFVPVGIPVPPGTPMPQIRAASQDTSTPQFDDNNLRMGPNGFGARSAEGMGLDFAKAANDTYNVTVTGPQGPVASGSLHVR